MRIGMTFDLRSTYLDEGFSEDDVAEFDSDATVEAIENTLRELGHLPERVGHGRELCRRLVAGDRWDLVFNIAEGIAGRCREAQVPALLEMYGIPYTFSDPLVCCTTLDKAMTKRLVQQAGIATARFVTLDTLDNVETLALDYPLFAKPVSEGTGKGIDGRSRVDSTAALRETAGRLLRDFRQPVLVEEYLPGREFTTGLLGTGPRARVIGTMEVRIRPDAPTADYSYVVKEKCEQFVEYRPLEHGALRHAVEDLALAAHRALECRDAARVDVRLDRHGAPAFIEVNPLPGLHPHHSDLPMIATQEGMSYVELLGSIIHSALERAAPARPS